MNLIELHEMQGRIESFQNAFYDLKEALIDNEEDVQQETLAVLSVQVNRIKKKIEYFKTEKGIAINKEESNIASMLERLFRLIAECSGISRLTLLEAKKYRKREQVQARHVHMYAIKMLTGFSLRQIGALYYHKDHATVLHAAKTVDGLMETSRDFRDQYAKVFDFILEKIGDPIPEKKQTPGLLKFKEERKNEKKISHLRV